MFPNPFDLLGGAFDWLLDKGGDVIAGGIQAAVGWLVGAVVGALSDLTGSILGFFWDAAEPDVSAPWFAGSDSSPYGQTLLLAAPLLVAFFFAGVIQGALRGDTAGMLRMAIVRLPGSVLAMTVVIAVTDLLVRISNDMSEAVLARFRDDVEATTRLLASLAALPGISAAAQFLLLVFGGLGVLAAATVVLLLFVRAALIYLVVALSPLIYAAAIWEPMRGGVRKLGELGLALIVSKFAIALGLAVSAAALVAAADGQPTELATPEQAAASAASVAQTVGLVVGAVVMFLVAAFMPFVLFRLLPIAEAALVSHGVGSAPVRAAQQGANVVALASVNPATAALFGARRRNPAALPATGAGIGAAGWDGVAGGPGQGRAGGTSGGAGSERGGDLTASASAPGPVPAGHRPDAPDAAPGAPPGGTTAPIPPRPSRSAEAATQGPAGGAGDAAEASPPAGPSGGRESP
ncbi:MAG TPA: hypothetical protein VE575_11415, partial [Acidimicrobiales bacterium]|nr:hypothetical protein [Acidimicrobiales bacterium]